MDCICLLHITNGVITTITTVIADIYYHQLYLPGRYNILVTNSMVRIKLLTTLSFHSIINLSTY